MRQKDEKKRSQAVSGQVVGNKPHGPYDLSLSLLAFKFGRHFNQLSWNQLNAALFGKPEHYEQARAIWIELLKQFSGFIPRLEEDAIWRILRKFRHCEFHKRWLFRLNEEICRRTKDGSNFKAREGELAKFPACKKLRESVLEELTDKYISAFHLGEYIDGLLRSPYAFALLDTLDDLTHWDGTFRLDLGSIADWLANHSCLEDWFEPEEKWRQHLQWLWEEARILRSVPVLPDGATLSTEQRKQLVPHLAKAAVEGLKARNEKVIPNLEFATNERRNLNEQSSELPRRQPRIANAAVEGLKVLDEKVIPNFEFATKEGRDLNEQSSELPRRQPRIANAAVEGLKVLDEKVIPNFEFATKLNEQSPSITGLASNGSGKKRRICSDYLGLEVDEDSRQVRRNGWENPALFEGNVKAFEVFLALHGRGGNYFRTTDLIHHVWGDFVIEKSTLYTTISMTKSIISGLRLTIINKKNLGYRLVERNKGRQKRR
jgi:hypothetical protein